MTLRTALVITGDAAGATRALSDTARAAERTGEAVDGLAAKERAAAAAADALSAELRDTQATTEGLAAAQRNAAAGAQALDSGLRETRAAADGLTTSERAAIAATAALDAELRQVQASAGSLTASERSAVASTDALATELREARAVAEGLAKQLTEAREAAAALAGRVDVLETQLGRANKASSANVRSMGEQAMGARMLGQQIQDMGLMMAMSGLTAESALRAISVQAGQTALAVEQMGVGGALGATARFLGGPWGALVLTGAMILAPFIAKLLETKNEAAELADKLDKAASAADSFGNASSMLGKIIDLNTGRFKNQNIVLRETIRLQAEAMLLKGQKDETEARKKLKDLGRPDWMTSIGAYYADNPAANYGGASTQAAQQNRVRNQAQTGGLAKLRDDMLAGQVNATQIRERIDMLAKTGELAGYSAEKIVELKQQLYELPRALNDQKAAKDALAAIDGKGVAPELKPYSAPKKDRKRKDTGALGEFGRDAVDRIATITEAFERTPPAVRQADRAIRQLDDLIDDLSRKKPPNFEATIASAQAAKNVVREGLLRELTEAYRAPETLAEKAAPALAAIDALIKEISAAKPQGFETLIAQAEAAKGVIQDGIQRPYADFIQQQQQSIEITRLIVDGREDEAEALRTIFALQKTQGPLDADHKAAILATVQALRAEQRELDVLRAKAQKYANALDDVRSAITGALTGRLDQIEQLPKRLMAAFQNLRGEVLFEKLFGDAFRELQDRVNGTSVVKDASARMAAAVDKASSAILKLGRAASTAASEITGEPADPKAAANDEIVVTGSRVPKDPAGFFSYTVEKLAKGVLGENAAKAIGKFAGKGLEGAATGQLVSGISNALGIKMNSTGAQIGGAIGNFIPIPGGQIIGSIAGGLLGNLFEKPKYGTAFLTNATDKVKAGGRGESAISAASGLAASVQGGLKRIADALGGELGNFDVVVGQYNGKYRVRTTAAGWDGKGGLDFKGNSANYLHDFGNDEAGALAFAIADAIKDGGVKGLSAAVQRALQSSPDIDAALAEATKVGNLETLLGGLPAELATQFKSFEREARDRLRIARQYGFDVVEVEKINARERLALTKQLEEQTVGSLKKLVDEMTHGSLFEGTAIDRRTELLKAIEVAKADVAAGTQGAADTLANLLEQLNGVSKDVYASTGGYVTDRTSILDQARAAIAKANADIAAAQARASDPALATTNKALDENNDQNARMIASLDDVSRMLGQILNGSRSTLDELRMQARTS